MSQRSFNNATKTLSKLRHYLLREKEKQTLMLVSLNMEGQIEINYILQARATDKYRNEYMQRLKYE